MKPLTLLALALAYALVANYARAEGPGGSPLKADPETYLGFNDGFAYERANLCSIQLLGSTQAAVEAAQRIEERKDSGLHRDWQKGFRAGKTVAQQKKAKNHDFCTNQKFDLEREPNRRPASGPAVSDNLDSGRPGVVLSDKKSASFSFPGE